MSEEPAPRLVDDIRELLDLSTPTRVTTYELHGQLVGEAMPPEDERQNVNVAARVTPATIEARVRMEHFSDGARLFADVGMEYTLDEPVTIEQETLRLFLEMVGMMGVYPFLRESLFTTAARLGIAAPILGLLHQGSFHVQQTEDAQPWGG